MCTTEVDLAEGLKKCILTTRAHIMYTLKIYTVIMFTSQNRGVVVDVNN